MSPQTVAAIAARHWASIKHGTLYSFVQARVSTAPGPFGENLEHFQAFAVELDCIIQQIVKDPENENGFSETARRQLPVLKKQTRRGIDKYATALKHWQEEITFQELETFVSAIFVWK